MAEILGVILGIGGMVNFFAGLFWLIVATVRKTAKRIAVFVLFGGFVAFCIGVAISPSPEALPTTPSPTPTVSPTPGPSPTPAPTSTPSPTPVPTLTPTLSELGILLGAQDIAYDDILRNKEQYVGQMTMIVGEVFQAIYGFEDPDVPGKHHQSALVNVSSSSRVTRRVWLDFSGPRVLEGDRIGAVSEVRGLKTYKTVTGVSRTVPQLFSDNVRITVPR